MKRYNVLFVLLLALFAGSAAFAQSTAKAVYLDGKLTFYFDAESHTGTTYNMPATNSKPLWEELGSAVNRVAFDGSFKDYRPTSLYYWFFGFSSLTVIEGLTNLNTSETKDMSQLFRYCSSLQTLDLSSFNTAKVTDMYAMFDACKSLRTIDLSSFNTENVTSMSAMFDMCSSLQTLDLSNFNTGNVNNMGWMFANCSALQTLDLTSFDTKKVTKMETMFANDAKLTRIYVSDSFDVSKVTNSEGMFKGCTSLQGAISFSSDKTDAKYANYTTGYFTYSCAPIVRLNDKGYATFSYSQDIQIIDGAKAYIAAESHGQIICQETYNVPAGSGVILYGMPGAIVGFQHGNPGSLPFNGLSATTLSDGSLATIPTTGFTFVLSGDKFMKYTGAQFSPRKAYFNLDSDPTSSGAPLRISFGDIDHISTTLTNDNNSVSSVTYRIDGTPSHSTSGLNIVNGRLQFNK